MGAPSESTQVDGPGYTELLQLVFDRMDEWSDRVLAVEPLGGGL
ncbi:MAG: hypothetical protein QOE86_1715, partial [Solirubrobacteraceae bacterium]|nr:hypothetical protein [Solirubrobacteraceae bacterium]